MNPEIKQKWIERLRSGKYQQGVGTLKCDRDKYCCLGILCEMYKEETNNGEWLPVGHSTQFKSGEFLNSKSTGVLTREVIAWAGFEEGRADPIIAVSEKYKTQITASTMNDRLELSFSVIADVIEGKPSSKVEEYLAIKRDL